MEPASPLKASCWQLEKQLSSVANPRIPSPSQRLKMHGGGLIAQCRSVFTAAKRRQSRKRCFMIPNMEALLSGSRSLHCFAVPLPLHSTPVEKLLNFQERLCGRQADGTALEPSVCQKLQIPAVQIARPASMTQGWKKQLFLDPVRCPTLTQRWG